MQQNKQNIFVISEENKAKRLDVFLQENIDFTRSQIKNFIELGNVFVNDKVVKAGFKLRVKDKVLVKDFKLPQIDLLPQNIKLDVVFENEDFAIINKPQGMVVHPAAGNLNGTLVNALIFHFDSLSASDDVRPGIVHRLDKNTSGLLIVAKNNKTHNYFANLIKQRKTKKKYLALCSGYFKQKEGSVATNIGRDKKNRKKMAVCTESEGKQAITKYKVIEEFNGFSLVEFELVTGRTHQIRLHASYLKHPVVGDEVYGGNTKLYANGQLLHSHYLEFASPTNGEKVSFNIPLPDHFLRVVNSLKDG